jgi:hypothetical protein
MFSFLVTSIFHVAAAEFNIAAAKLELILTLVPDADIDAITEVVMVFQDSANSIEVQSNFILLRETFILNIALVKSKVA